jgi:hypothetical protein
MNICDNKICTYNEQVAFINSDAPYIDVVKGGKNIRVYRYLYKNSTGAVRFFLCDVCHAAVQMVIAK